MAEKDANIAARAAGDGTLDPALVEEIQNVLLNGLAQFPGSGLVEIGKIEQPTPEKFAELTPEELQDLQDKPTLLAAQSIAIGIVKAMSDQIKENVLDILSKCTVQVTDSSGATLTGTIVYNEE